MTDLARGFANLELLRAELKDKRDRLGVVAQQLCTLQQHHESLRRECFAMEETILEGLARMAVMARDRTPQ